MPEFVPCHTPNGLDEFTRGYLECVEWLLPEEVDTEGNVVGGPPHDKMRGFARETLKRVKRECRDFQRDNAPALAFYCTITGRGLDYAGHDFFLTRNGHGAGFWDRGSDPVFHELTEAAHAYGSTWEELWRGWLHSYS